jgi:hypothetical protein
VRLVCLGEAKLGLWRLADSYPAAQTEVLGVLPKLPAPLLSLAQVSHNPHQPRMNRASHFFGTTKLPLLRLPVWSAAALPSST